VYHDRLATSQGFLRNGAVDSLGTPSWSDLESRKQQVVQDLQDQLTFKVSGMILLLGMLSVFPCSIKLFSSAKVKVRISPCSAPEEV
jgi:hypothetical protein